VEGRKRVLGLVLASIALSIWLYLIFAWGALWLNT